MVGPPPPEIEIEPRVQAAGEVGEVEERSSWGLGLPCH